jgi:hypothetical protein
MATVGRNQSCPCGSGKKYKKCCLQANLETERLQREAEQYEADVYHGRIDPFASDEEWPNEPEYDWEDSQDEEWSDEPGDNDSDFDFDDDYDYNSDDVYDEDDEKDGDRELTADEFNSLDFFSKDLSKENAKLIESWWEKYPRISDPVKFRAHIEDFMNAHPDLVKDLNLVYEPISEFELMCREQGCYDLFIEVVTRLRQEFPDAYLQGFAYLDNKYIQWLIRTGRKEDVPGYLANFREKADEEPEELLELIHVLQSCNCQDILVDFISHIANEVVDSPFIVADDETMKILFMTVMSPFLDNGLDAFDAEKVSRELEKFPAVFDPDWFNTENIQDTADNILGRYEWQGLDDCSSRSEAMQRYEQVMLNFMGWLHANKNMHWCTADFYHMFMYIYLTEALPMQNKPHEPFPLTEVDIQRIFHRLSRGTLFEEEGNAFGMLNSIYWFSEYLEERQSLAPEKAACTRTACVEMFNSLWKRVGTNDCTLELWQQFPREM